MLDWNELSAGKFDVVDRTSHFIDAAFVLARVSFSCLLQNFYANAQDRLDGMQNVCFNLCSFFVSKKGGGVAMGLVSATMSLSLAAAIFSASTARCDGPECWRLYVCY